MNFLFLHIHWSFSVDSDNYFSQFDINDIEHVKKTKPGFFNVVNGTQPSDFRVAGGFHKNHYMATE